MERRPAHSAARCPFARDADQAEAGRWLDLACRQASDQQSTWASGDFAVIGTTLQIVGESLAEAADVCADERVLDVAAGNGNATLAAARRFARVTSTDYGAGPARQGLAKRARSRCALR